MMRLTLPLNCFSFSDAIVHTNTTQEQRIIEINGDYWPYKVGSDIIMRRHSLLIPSDDVFHRNSYRGGKDYIEQDYLFTHDREKSTDYENRKQRAYFYNYVRPVIDSYLFFLFKATPIRIGDTATELDVIRFIADPSKGTEDLNDMMRFHTFTLLLLGRSWLRMDAPPVPPISKFEEEDRHKLPYIYHYTSEDVLDWAEGEEGRLRWVKAWSREDAKTNPFYASAANVSIKIWTPNSIVRYDEEGQYIDGVPNFTGVVPFILTKLNPELKSFIADISIINRALFNWCSLLDEILYKQTFSQLVVPGDEKQALSEKRVGIASAFTFPPDARHAPHFISPDVDQGNLVQKQIDVAIMEIYRAANLEWVDSKRATNKSGSAKMFDFQNTNKVLGGIASSLEQTERNIFWMYDQIRDKDREPAKTQYPRDFSVAALESELTNIFFALTRQISPHLNKLLKKRAAVLLLPRIEEKDRNIIEKEIDETEELAGLTEDDISMRVREMTDAAMAANIRGSKGRVVRQAVE